MLHRPKTDISNPAEQSFPLDYPSERPHVLLWEFFTSVSTLFADIAIILLEATTPRNSGDNTFPTVGAMLLCAQLVVGAVVAAAVLRDPTLVRRNMMTITAMIFGMALSASAIVFGIAR